MKRIILIAACALFALAACNKPEKEGEKEMALPKYKEYHAKFSLEDRNFAEAQVEGIVPRTIELTSGGKFILGFYDADASSTMRYVSGEYTVTSSKAVSADLIFNFPRYGTLAVNEGSGENWNVSYTPPAGTSYNGAAVVSADILSGEMADDICRSWEPKSIIILASGGDFSTEVGGVFSNDIREIIEYLNGKGMKINPEDFADLSLKSIDYTESGLLLINFKDFAISPFVGNFTLNDSEDENMTYDFNLSWKDQPVIPLKGVGTVIVSDNQMTIRTESDVVVKTKTYHITVSIVCDEIK